MASIFDDVFVGGSAVKASANPQVALDGFAFALLQVEPTHPWEKTGKKDENGREERKPNKAKYITDESGERIQIALGLQLIDAAGRATSPKALYREATHFFDFEKTKALVACAQRAGRVSLENARIEFVDSTRDGFIKSVPRLVFDDISVV